MTKEQQSKSKDQNLGTSKYQMKKKRFGKNGMGNPRSPFYKGRIKNKPLTKMEKLL